MKPRAELHQSAPIAIARAMSNAVAILPAAPIRMRSRALMPISALWTKLTPSRIGMPRWSMNSSGCRAGAALIAVDHDEIRIDPGLQHRLADRQELPGMADAQLEAGGLAAGQPPHLADERHHFQRRRKCLVIRRRNAVLVHRDAPDPGDLLGDLGRGQHAAMAGFGALADLEFDHLDLVVAGDLRE